MTQADRFEIYELATVHNRSYSDLAEAYEVSEDEIEQIVLSFSPTKES
jgi:hypothetical protein